jgi:hypothetical protein
MTDIYTVTIRFQGELNQVNADTFINSLASFVRVVQEVNQAHFREHEVDIRINALNKGSFQVELDLVAFSQDAISRLIDNVDLRVTSNLAKIVIGLYELRSFLRGRKPKDVNFIENRTEIVNQDESRELFSNRVYSLYNSNLNINEALNNNFEALNSDSSIAFFEILDKDNSSIFKADKQTFSELASQEKFDKLLPEEKLIRVRTSVHIFKIVFDDKSKWDFIYRGNKINAKILDDEFYDKVDKGEKFSKGDSLEVELEITQYYEESVNVFLNKNYTITKVHRHQPRENQLHLKL